MEVYHAAPRVLAALEPLTRERGKRAAITTWETQGIPIDLVQALSKFDGVIVPSGFCADALCARPNVLPFTRVHIVPHGFDESFWRLPSATRDTLIEARDAAYRFYSIGAWGERKNVLGIIRAYLHAFTKADHVQLMLLVDNANFDEIRSVIARAGLAPGDLPELYVPDHKLDDVQLLELHGSADCFVSATRGEGFGLGMFEAAIMGRRVIAPLFGGQEDFLDEYAWFTDVPYQLTPCFGSEGRGRVEEIEGQKYQVSTIDLPPGVNCKQLWAEPDLYELAKAMRDTYDRRNVARSDADMVYERQAFEARFGYNTIGPLLAQRLREITYT